MATAQSLARTPRAAPAVAHPRTIAMRPSAQSGHVQIMRGTTVECVQVASMNCFASGTA
jgi:hypothetical protein